MTSSQATVPGWAASIARAALDALSIAASGFLGFCAAGAMIGYHLLDTSIAGRLLAAYAAVLVFAADRYLAERHIAMRWARWTLTRIQRLWRGTAGQSHASPAPAKACMTMTESSALRHGRGES